MQYRTLKTSQLSADIINSCIVDGQQIEIVRQPTGYGSKRLFLCPTCKDRRAKLIIIAGAICCRGCAPFDVYRERRSLYDEGGYSLIVWHMRKTARAAGLPLEFPFKYYRYIDPTLRYKKAEARRKALHKLQMLENMRFSAIAFSMTFAGKQIREYTAPAFMEQFTLWQLERFIVFSPSYSPHKARQLMPERPEWMATEPTAAETELSQSIKKDCQYNDLSEKVYHKKKQ